MATNKKVKMNYINIYNDLIDRGRIERNLIFKELHHVVPRCLGGNNSKENLVALTPEEHFVAHQLLVKIYPQNIKLILAARMMTIGQNGKRRNKLYGWLKKQFKLSSVNNKSKKWYHNHGNVSKKFQKNTQPTDWLYGRVCIVCGTVCSSSRQTCSHSCKLKLVSINVSQTVQHQISNGRVWRGHAMPKKAKKFGVRQGLRQGGSKNSQFGSFWITNGIQSRKNRGNVIPEGWRRGRTTRV